MSRAEQLDATLEPFAQLGLILLVLLACAALGGLVIYYMATRRRDKQHQRVSNSKRDQQTGIDLFGSTASDPAEPRPEPRPMKRIPRPRRDPAATRAKAEGRRSGA